MKQRNNIAVELTPLLDVILIILFLIITRNNAETERVKTEAEAAAAEYSVQLRELESALSDGEKQLAEAENVIAGYESFKEYSVIISVGVIRGEDGKRVISVSENGGTAEIIYGWDNIRYGENALRAELEKRLPEEPENHPVFITFAYSDDDIYRRDYQLVTDVLDNLKGENIYITYSDMNAADIQYSAQ